MAAEMATEFSEDGKYFAQLSTDGKLKVWDTVANSFEQEFTPDFHLTSPCTCLHFINSQSGSKDVSPKKKKRRESISEPGAKIVLGTTSGSLLVYSIAKANVECSINSNLSQGITCISIDEANKAYTGADQDVLVWNLTKRSMSSKWKTGNEKVTSILNVPGTKNLLTASKTIKLWSIDKKELLKTFTGHSSNVVFLKYICPRENSDSYFISGAKDDRILNCWTLSNTSTDKNAVTSFLMEDIVQNISINTSSDGTTSLAASVRSGVVHIYQHTLNGKCGKPLKPKTTLQVVSDTGQNKSLVVPIKIFGSIFRDDNTLCIGHGTEIIITFENITITTYQKLHCLVRKDPRRVQSANENEVTKIKTPIVGNDVLYVTPQTSAVGASKRKNDGQQEVPMEKRLENLTLNKLDSASGVPKGDNVAQLLVQGLHSKDKKILNQVLLKRDDNIIRNTVRRLPITVVVPLVEELNTKYLKGKTNLCQIGALWLRHILQIHSGILISNPSLGELLGSSLMGIENRLSLLTPLNRLKGRINLLSSQISTTPESNEVDEEEALLVFDDKDSDSEVENLEMDAHSESENEWEESENEEEVEENHKENNVNSSSEEDDDEDEEMSDDDDSS
ncbi:unnamed protein product [Brassicogethes aeneus]|uniref:Small-subunit processome Utp12 domain-containing protein n=1 Tax=Brassicogethes aeneus TaxID=1431903 RepID=A0A9P0AQU3_BRAAE|nr:unnamed protein product [Brassicogethes aeneus]